ncbi:hypothetical protein SBADM41S_04563 [Streptomyces badius]
MNPDRRDRLRDAAIEVLARDGGRGLTHRAVDRAAEVPPGTTKNYFPTRDAVLRAVAERCLEQYLALTGQLAAGPGPGDREALVRLFRSLLENVAGPGRSRILAVLELQAEATRRPWLSGILDPMASGDFEGFELAQRAAGLPVTPQRAAVVTLAPRGGAASLPNGLRHARGGRARRPRNTSCADTPGHVYPPGRRPPNATASATTPRPPTDWRSPARPGQGALIWFKALTTKFTSTANYAAARTGTLAVASGLYGATSPEYAAVATPGRTSTRAAGGGDPDPGGKVFENATPVNIPDAGAAVTSAVNVTGIAGNAPSTLKADVNITHTYRGDLVIDLVAPDGGTFRLKNSSASDSADNVVATYTVNASSKVANGQWKLRVQDVYRSDTGRINSFKLTF